MYEKLPKILKTLIMALLIFQLAGCGTLLYPERRGQVAGRLDVGVVVLDGIGLLFFLIPGIIAFAVDFGNGCIYLPRPLYRAPVVVGTQAELRVIKFDPKHTSLAQIEQIIKAQTGYTVHLAQGDVRTVRLKSKHDMMEHFAQAAEDMQHERLALNR